MSILGDKQRKFAHDICLLILYAEALGYSVTFQPEHENHMDDSLHYIALAKDINIFIDIDEDGNEDYLNDTEDHLELGLFWESMGNSWGGRFGDGNHYSIKHNGKR